jgi:hypothetical protein
VPGAFGGLFSVFEAARVGREAPYSFSFVNLPVLRAFVVKADSTLAPGFGPRIPLRIWGWGLCVDLR